MEKINPSMVKLARESREITLTELGTRLGMSATGAHYLEQNYHPVNPNTLNTLCSALRYPPCFFFQPGESLPLPLSYRKRSKIPAKQIVLIDAIVNIYRLNLEKLVKACDYREPVLPVLDTEQYGTPQLCAKNLRRLWNITPGPIENMGALLEEHGIMLVSYDFQAIGIDGKCTIAADKFPMIVTDRKLLGDRQRFTLAYHLGYLVMHWKTSPAFERDISHEANLFAAEFLMPEDDIKQDLTDLTFNDLPTNKKKWKASMISLLYRSEDLGLITENQKRYITQQFNDRGIKKREPIEYDVQVDKYKLVRDLMTFYKTNQRMSVTQLAEFFCMEQKEFESRYEF